MLVLLLPNIHDFNEKRTIDHFTVVCLVAWPLNESEAGVDLVLIETSKPVSYTHLTLPTKA